MKLVSPYLSVIALNVKGLNSPIKRHTGTSLVVQWLRVRLPMQGTGVRALVQEDPTCHGATKPVCHNYWAHVPRAHAPQRERSLQWEARPPQWRVAPARCNWRKPTHSSEDSTQPKIKQKQKQKKAYSDWKDKKTRPNYMLATRDLLQL